MTIYKRNSSLVLSNLIDNGGDQIITKVPCRIHMPVRYTEVGLGQIGGDTFTYGLFALILDSNEYTVCNINALLELNPSKTSLIKIDDVPYYEFYFEANTAVIKSTNILKRASIMFNVLDEFIFKGKVPWFVGYEDMGKLFDSSSYYSGINIGQNYEVIEFIAAMVTRSKKDRTKYIRLSIEKYEDVTLDKISYVPLKSVLYSVNSTVNKLSGSYFSEGVTSALVSPTDKVEKIESILRA